MSVQTRRRPVTTTSFRTAHKPMQYLSLPPGLAVRADTTMTPLVCPGMPCRPVQVSDGSGLPSGVSMGRRGRGRAITALTVCSLHTWRSRRRSIARTRACHSHANTRGGRTPCAQARSHVGPHPWTPEHCTQCCDICSRLTSLQEAARPLMDDPASARMSEGECVGNRCLHKGGMPPPRPRDRAPTRRSPAGRRPRG